MDDQPVFDFARISYKDARTIMLVQIEMRHIDLQLGNPDVLSNSDRYQQIVDRLNAAIDVTERLICKVLVSVPAGWLVDGAPVGLDWSEVESLDWIMAPYMNQIKRLVTEGLSQESVAKN